MGHNAICQVDRHTFLQRSKFVLNRTIIDNGKNNVTAPRQIAEAGGEKGAHTMANRPSGIGEFVQLGQNRGAKILERRQQL
jgi:hypothetical protein